MRQPKKPHNSPGREEARIIRKLDIMRNCKREMHRWIRLVRSKDFTTNLKKQNEATLIARGTCLKVETLKLAEKFFDNDHKDFINLLKYMASYYGDIWKKQIISLVGPDGGPIQAQHTISATMDIKALDDAIAKAKE